MLLLMLLYRQLIGFHIKRPINTHTNTGTQVRTFASIVLRLKVVVNAIVLSQAHAIEINFYILFNSDCRFWRCHCYDHRRHLTFKIPKSIHFNFPSKLYVYNNTYTIKKLRSLTLAVAFAFGKSPTKLFLFGPKNISPKTTLYLLQINE